MARWRWLAWRPHFRHFGEAGCVRSSLSHFVGSGEAVGGSGFVNDAHLKLGDRFIARVNNHDIPLRLVGVYFDTQDLGHVYRYTWSDYLTALPKAQLEVYLVTVRAGADIQMYAHRISASSPDFLSVVPRQASISPTLSALNAVLAILAIVLALIAVAGVFNTILLSTRERIRDTATLKTLGMTPLQVVTMVVASAVILGVIGGALGLPVGIWLHQQLLTLIGTIVNDQIPPGLSQGVFTAVNLPLLALVGVIAAVIGAAVPACIAAREPIVEVLRAE